MAGTVNIDEQAKTVDMLLSHVENLSVNRNDEFDDGALVFEGDGVDGPCVGYVEVDGSVTWIANGGFTS